jgi:class 3 adenylate cyclase
MSMFAHTPTPPTAERPRKRRESRSSSSQQLPVSTSSDHMPPQHLLQHQPAILPTTSTRHQHDGRVSGRNGSAPLVNMLDTSMNTHRQQDSAGNSLVSEPNDIVSPVFKCFNSATVHESASRQTVRSRSGVSFLTVSSAFRAAKPALNASARSTSSGLSTALGPRESHTADLVVFDRLVDRLGSCSRSSADTAFNMEVWSTIRGILAEFQDPLGLKSLPSRDEVLDVSPSILDAYLRRITRAQLIQPLNVFEIAAASRLPLQDVVTELLYAAEVDLVRIKFTPACSNCGGNMCRVDNLRELNPEVDCDACHQSSVLESLDDVKVLFKLHPDVFYAPANNSRIQISKFAMSKTRVFKAIPATEFGSGFIVKLGDSDSSEPALPAGRYRMRCPVSDTDNYLVVARDATAADAPHTATIRVSELCENRHGELQVPHGRLTLKVHPDTSSFFALWIMRDEKDANALVRLPQEEMEPYLSAAYIVVHPTSQRLLYGQTLPDNMSLPMQRAAIVSFGICNADSLHKHLGDDQALSLLRKYATTVVGVLSSKGRVFRFVGDVIMAAVWTPEEAIDVAAAAFQRAQKDCYAYAPNVEPESLEESRRRSSGTTKRHKRRIKIHAAIHAGPVLATATGQAVDFFGRTTTLVAKVLEAAKPGELLVTSAAGTTEVATEAVRGVVRDAMAAAGHPTPEATPELLNSGSTRSAITVEEHVVIIPQENGAPTVSGTRITFHRH